MVRKLSTKSSVTFILLLVLLLDQFTKFLAIYYLQQNKVISLFAESIQLSLIINYDGFLGIFQNTNELLKYVFLSAGVAVLLIVFLWFLYREQFKLNQYKIPLALITGGGLSNLLDRMIHDGGVVDFIRVGIETFHTGVFNLADMAILTGSFGIGYLLLNHQKR